MPRAVLVYITLHTIGGVTYDARKENDQLNATEASLKFVICIIYRQETLYKSKY